MHEEINRQGLEARRRNDLDEAERLFRQSDHPVCRTNLATVLKELDRLDEAKAEIFQVLSSNPKFNLALYTAGNILLAIVIRDGYDPRLIDLALRYYAASEIDDADTLSNWGMALVHKGDYAAALDKYNRAVDLDPEHREARFGRSQVLLSLGRFTEGWGDYRYRPGVREKGLNLA